jgi:L-threonylcarbamoyladenylate synthase
MPTVVVTVDARSPEPPAIARAADVLRAGGLVALPTETVYGLGANALNNSAVAKIFTAKRRPAANPLIVHVQDRDAARAVTAAWPQTAERLADRFWPGPLTLVLTKAECVPALVTAGGGTVGVRVPAHPVALALLRACELPLAAPSANRSSGLSPTLAAHVLADLDGRIDMVLDAGPSAGGLESTVLDLTSSPSRLLRPGLVSPADIEEVIGPIARAITQYHGKMLKSPGLLGRHYAPRTPLECVAEDGGAYARRLRDSGLRVGWLTYADDNADSSGIKAILLPGDPQGYAAALYAALHELDISGLDRIIVALPPQTEPWLAVHDRLRRATR